MRAIFSIGAWMPPYDDAYITLTSAQALYSGQIQNYPGTPPLYGITSPAHVALVAALLPCTAPLTALWLSQVIGCALYATGLWWLARAFVVRWQAGVFVLVGLSTGMVPHQLFNGLETGLALGAVTWALGLTVRRSRFATLVYGVLPFVRPELALLSVGLALYAVWEEPETWRRSALLMAAGAAPWTAFMLWQLGTVFPTSSSAKVAFLADRCLPAGTKIAAGVVAMTRWSATIGLVSLGVLGAWRSALMRVCLAVFAVAIIAYAINAPSQILRYHEQRYLYAWLPVLLLGLVTLKQRAIILPVVLIVGLLRVPAMYAEHRAWTDPFVAEERALVWWLDHHVPPDSRLLVIDAGYLAYATRYPLVDAVGLKSPASAMYHRWMTLPSCGLDRSAALALIARETGAVYFIPWGEWNRAYRMADGFAQQGWTVTLVRPKPPGAIGDWWYPVYQITPACAESESSNPSVRSPNRPSPDAGCRPPAP